MSAGYILWYMDFYFSLLVLLERTEEYSHITHMASLGEGKDGNFSRPVFFEVGEHFLSGQLCEKQKEMTLL